MTTEQQRCVGNRPIEKTIGRASELIVEIVMTLPTAQDFLLSTQLYKEISYTPDEAYTVLEIVFYKGTYDSYCAECKKGSTFRTAPEQIPINLDELEAANAKRKFFGDGKTMFPEIPAGVYKIAAHCTRDSSHRQSFFCLAGSHTIEEKDGQTRKYFTIQKVGQHPSYADLHIGQTRKYTNLLPSQYLKELNKAIGLASHGVGIGSYVYLRRIFEALIEEAHQEATKDHDWEEDKYLPLRTHERISLLKHHLPDFLVEHPHVYSILSKGIHELAEEDCLKHFDVLRESIELILEQRHEKREKQKRMAAIKAALSKTAGDLK